MASVRPGFLWPLTALLVVAAVFLPLGHKSVEAETCGGDWRTGRVCERDLWEVDYRLLSMQTHHVHMEDEEVIEDRRWAYPYTSAAPHPDGITPLLVLGGFAALPAGLASLAAGLWHAIQPTPLTRRLHLGAWALLATALAMFLVGVAIHSGTWVAQRSDWWRPGPGLVALGSLASGWRLLPQRQAFGMPALPPGSGA